MAYRALLASTALMFGAASAQLSFVEAEYESDIPTLKSVVGHAPGLDITSPAEAMTYLEKLQAAAPDRMKIVQYAESWEGRPLVYVVISSPENMERLDEIKKDLDRLADGRSVTGRERERLIEELPAVTWLAYGVHGDEISSTDAGLALAYHLLAAEGDENAQRILDETIVIIDPMQNPDGRARFMNSFDAARGLEVQGAREAAERDQPWPGGRYNHALFDMNRDWFSLTQPETRGKVQAVLEWNPVVLVDVHEMGSDSTYFFAPAARPFNPQLQDNQKEGQVIIGRANGETFDENGIPYFTREVYDAFYPGYGDMWPALGGAVSMTYEQASARGLRHDKENGESLTYRDGVRNHFLATLTTASTVAKNKERFLSAYAQNRQDAVEEGEASDERYFLIDLADRQGQAEDLGLRLAAQGIAVSKVEAGAELCGTDYPRGALVIDRAQPRGRMITTLLEKDTPLAEDFLKEQEERRAAGLGYQLYDVTAWSLPLMDDVTVRNCADLGQVETVAYGPDAERSKMPVAEAKLGYAVPWTDSTQAKIVIEALKEGLTAMTTDTAFTQEGREFPRGTVVFPAARNGDHLSERMASIVEAQGGEVVAMQSSWVEDGPNLGSESFRELTMPKVAMAWGEGTSPLSAGAARFVLERQLGVPVTPIRVMSMSRAELGDYDVVILPELGYSFDGMLGGRGKDALKEFTQEGGVLVTFGSATRTLGEDGLGFLPLVRENKVRKDGMGGRQSDGSGTELWSEEDYHRAIASDEASPDRVPGVLLNAVAEENHWLSAGYD
ncbi:MAG: M14 family metallopeptidase, partial [Parvularcula sp.]|nr:M14 family metallopeptidase [Parvularcula sp.]